MFRLSHPEEEEERGVKHFKKGWSSPRSFSFSGANLKATCVPRTRLCFPAATTLMSPWPPRMVTW